MLPEDDTATWSPDLSPAGCCNAEGTELETDDYVTAIGSTDADLQVIIDRAPLDSIPDMDDYLVKLSARFEVYRLTFGISLPSGALPADYPFADCMNPLQTGSPSGAVFNCASGSLGPSVNESMSLAFGPTDDTVLGHSDILYVSVQGKLPTGEDPPMNHTTTLLQIPLDQSASRVILGTLSVPEGRAAPTPTSVGVVAFAQLAGLGLPLQPNVGLDSSLGDAFLSGTGADTLDSDGDAITDDSENCLHAFNPDQSDRGGLMLTHFDGRGDACECGDLFKDPNNPGAVFDNDVNSGLQFLAGGLIEPDAPEFCSVATERDGSSLGTECNSKDLVVLQRVTGPSSSGSLEQACPRAQPPL